LGALHPGDVTKIFRPVIGNAELLLLCAFAQAATAYRAPGTDMELLPLSGDIYKADLNYNFKFDYYET
tara:strand:+ start:1239 stop:1442 length:204 start_codon:yes stop_codon:yes gene_type:complete